MAGEVYRWTMSADADDLVPDLTAVARACVYLHTRMAARALGRAFDAALRPLGIETGQFNLLAALIADPAASVTALADRMAMERSSLSRNLALLRRKGLIEEAGREGRAVAYRATGEGRALCRAVLPLWRSEQERFEAAIGGGEAWAGTRAALRALRREATGRNAAGARPEAAPKG